MKRKAPASAGTSVTKQGECEGTPNELSVESVLGSTIFIRLDGDIWWPAQVVDENSVSESNKPDDGLPGEILVRLYGSYQYLYADPITWCSEFNDVLKQRKCTQRDVFQKALEQEIATLRLARSKRQESKDKARMRNGAPKGQKSNKNQAKRTQDVEDSKSKDTVRRGKRKSQLSHEDKKESCKQGVREKKLKAKVKEFEQEVQKKPRLNVLKKGKRGKMTEQEPVNPKEPSSPVIPEELSTRRQRVMQTLGLIGPSGSPFHKTDSICLSF